MATIFYSWQSDLPNNINRGFIKDALEKAIKRVTEALQLEEAPRIEQDTSGVPGSPEIVNTILEKIEKCTVFIPDLTIVAHTDKKEPSPNPNVLIEYGYALKTLGAERIISVMNEAFGSAENSLPFDLKHRRFPIRYNLKEEASEEERKKEKENLISNLENALKTTIEAGLLERKPKHEKAPEPVSETNPIWGSSSFIGDRETIAKTDRMDPTGEPRNIIWFNGPQAFLRIIPSKISSWTPYDLEKLIHSGGLASMGDEGNANWILRNNRGAINVCCEDSKKPGTFLTAVGLTQVFKNGEIWGIEGYSLRKEAEITEGNTKIKYIASGYIENLFTRTLQNYLVWAKSSLKLDTPLKYVIGVSGIKDYSIAVDIHRIDGYCVEDEVTNYGKIVDYNISIAEILVPFFKTIWESCGVERPVIRR
jgi:hypothetical protein